GTVTIGTGMYVIWPYMPFFAASTDCAPIGTGPPLTWLIIGAPFGWKPAFSTPSFFSAAFSRSGCNSTSPLLPSLDFVGSLGPARGGGGCAVCPAEVEDGYGDASTVDCPGG